LYAILQKLEEGERLEPTDVAWLQENKIECYQPLFSGKISIAHHKIEATFYEQEYKRTGNKWNLPNASSHWRKADRPKQALKLTENLNFDKIKENKLKSAILTTRGGAFRDIGDLDKAEKCARQAIEYQPNSHHPYTLMGAICFERGEYSEGEYWFAEAIKRGASPRDQDAEIKRVVKNAKDENKRREVVEYLLKKDPQRYAWAKSYLKKPQNKGK
jgi:tetratricopeptide (TPR) repeat protein